MTRISYAKDKHNENIEYSNVMITNKGEVIFIEVNLDELKVKIKDIEEGIVIESIEFNSIEEARQKARDKVVELGVQLNQEIRQKE